MTSNFSLVVGSVGMTFSAVAMAIPVPSLNPQHWLAFLVPGGKFITIDSFEAERVQFYMRRQHTEALRDEETGVNYTLAGFRLVECDPEFSQKMEAA